MDIEPQNDKHGDRLVKHRNDRRICLYLGVDKADERKAHLCTQHLARHLDRVKDELAQIPMAARSAIHGSPAFAIAQRR